MITKFIFALRALKSFINVVRDIDATDDVFVLSNEVKDPKYFDPVIKAVSKNPSVVKAFEEKYLITDFDIPRLAELPVGTLGREYAQFMRANNLSPNFYPNLELTDDVEYFKLHLYQTHDIWHVITGFDTTPAGELGLQAFYYAQLNGPLPIVLLAAGLLNGLLYNFADMPNRMAAITEGWTMGRNAQALLGLKWDQFWQTPIAQLRKDLGIVPAHKSEVHALAGAKTLELSF
jgi:ubiquinone biosynthesis protein COQ4